MLEHWRAGSKAETGNKGQDQCFDVMTHFAVSLSILTPIFFAEYCDDC